MRQVKSLGVGKGFKRTEIGEIPSDWEVARLGNVCEVIGGSTPSTIKKEFWEGNIPWATPTDITALASNTIAKTEKAITQKGLTHSAAKLLPVGSILLTNRATIGECAINVVPMATNQGFTNLICKKVNTWFVFYYLRFSKSELIRLASGSTFKEISKKSIRSLSFPLPANGEQERIGEILSAVDNTSQKLSEIIDKSKQLKKGMMNRLFARGIGHGRFNGTEIGVIPNDWRMSRLGEVCEVVGGGTPSTKKREFWDGDIPWATPTDITSLASNTIDKTEKEITQEGLTQSAAKLMPVGSILLTTRATIGECAINVVPMATNQCFINLICKNASNWFIFHYLRHIKGEMIRLASGSTLKEISKQSIRTLSVPIPSLKEQEKVAEILNSIDAEIEHAILYQENLGGLKHVLMRVLLTGKVRVKV